MKILNIDKLYTFLANFGISSANNLGEKNCFYVATNWELKNVCESNKVTDNS